MNGQTQRKGQNADLGDREAMRMENAFLKGPGRLLRIRRTLSCRAEISLLTLSGNP